MTGTNSTTAPIPRTLIRSLRFIARGLYQQHTAAAWWRIADNQPCDRSACQGEAGGNQHDQPESCNKGPSDRLPDLFSCLTADLLRYFDGRQFRPLFLDLFSDLRPEIEPRQVRRETLVEIPQHHDTKHRDR